MRFVDSWESKEVSVAGTEGRGEGRGHQPTLTNVHLTVHHQLITPLGDKRRGGVEGVCEKHVGSFIIHLVLKIVTECLLWSWNLAGLSDGKTETVPPCRELMV